MYFHHADIDGGYGDWSEWTVCDKECGEGAQFRERACNSPLPRGNGKDCEEAGQSIETKSCLVKECPSMKFIILFLILE